MQKTDEKTSRLVQDDRLLWPDALSFGEPLWLYIAVTHLAERLLACQGELVVAAPQFESVEGMANAGLLLALPAVIDEGLLRRAERVYAPLQARQRKGGS